MERLDTKTLPRFLETADVAVILFGTNEGQSAFSQAEQFALLWAKTLAGGMSGIRFGYIDGSPSAGGPTLGIDHLPSTLVVRNGVVTHRFEGFCPYNVIATALASRVPDRCAWVTNNREHAVEGLGDRDQVRWAA
jgi:hypothetical protein